MPVETVFRNVEFAANKPLCEWRFPVENFFPWLLPDQLTRFARPEFCRSLDRLSIHPPILIETFDSRLLCETPRRSKDTLLDQVRFDVVMHKQSLICRGNFWSKRSVPRCALKR